MSASGLFDERTARLLQACIHCGICLSACPTYNVTGRESDSPRGRLALMHWLDSEPGEIVAGSTLHIDLCLGCLACQTACPSGVQYDGILHDFRARQQGGGRSLSLKRKTMVIVFTSDFWLRLLSGFIRLLQVTGLATLLQRLWIVPQKVRFQLAGLPVLRGQRFSKQKDVQYPAAAPDGSTHGRVALFTGCVMNHWYGPVHDATIRALQWNGWEVVIPAGQECCGSVQSHNGWESAFQQKLEHNRGVFRELDVAAILFNAAGCTSEMMPNLFPDGTGPPAVDATRFVADHMQSPPVERLRDRIAFDSPCHMIHAQGEDAAPHVLMRAACAQPVQLEEYDMCCGSAGLYSWLNPEMSRQVLSRKMTHVEAAGLDLLVTANPGCQMQLQGGLRMGGSDTPVLHIMELLDKAYSQDARYRRQFGLPE